MKFSELPVNVQQQLRHEQEVLADIRINEPYEVLFHNPQGTRYFRARRCVKAWADDKGNSMPFGGGSEWHISYGRMAFRRYRSCMGTPEYELVEGPSYRKSANGTEIPEVLATKVEVLELARKIGIV